MALLLPGFGCWSQDQTTAGLGKTNEGGTGAFGVGSLCAFEREHPRGLKIDILDGKVNGTIIPNSTVGQIKLKLPCFTSFEEEGTAAKCGAGVFYKDKGFIFSIPPALLFLEI